MDTGIKAAETAEKEIEKKLKRIYRQARREMNEKLVAYVSGFAEADARMKKLLDDDKITPEEYRRWKQTAVFRGENWKKLVRQSSKILSHSNQAAMQIVNDEKLGVFAENANYQAYKVDQRTGLDLAFAIYDEETVKRLIKEEPELIHFDKVSPDKDMKWINKQITNAVTQGIIQGEAIEKIAKRIATQTGMTNEKAMIRYSRTAVTSAQNAGRIDTMRRARDMGIRCKKKWLATLDSRTRDSHQRLDGQEQEIDDPFESIFGDIMFPGDPEAHPGDRWNCRCTLEYIYPDYPMEHAQRWDNESGEVIEDVTYTEWKRAKGGETEPEQPKEGYQPDENDKEYAELKLKLEEAKKRHEVEKEKYMEAERKFDSEVAQYEELKRIVLRDISKYERFETEEDYKQRKDELYKQIERLQEERSTLGRSPRRENFSSDEAHEDALEKYLDRKSRITQAIEQAESEYYGYQFDWKTIEKVRRAKELGIEEIIRLRNEALANADEARHKLYGKSDEVKAIEEKLKEFGIEETALTAQRMNVEWLTPAKATEPFDSDKVIAKLSGPDQTEGCCASLAFAYAGQRAGYDVVDYRGGESRSIFSRQCVDILKSIQADGKAAVSVGKAKSYTTAGKRALRDVQEGKEYYFECGSHAAIVRKVNGDLQYLEMQSGYRPNTWYSFERRGLEATLKWRFGSGSRTNGWEVESYLVDIDEMAQDKRFVKLLGFINTKPDKQMKGVGGGEK